MKTQRKEPTKKAVCVAGKTAKRHTQLKTIYYITTGKSNGKLKEQIGMLLLYLQTPLPEKEQQNYWSVFESGLRRFIELKSCEVECGKN